MAELYHGPIQQWTPDTEDAATIESYLSSEDPVKRAYGEAYQDGCWIREWGSMDPERPNAGMTAVGDLNKLLEVEFRTGTELNQNEFSLGDCIGIGAFPGQGADRIERIYDGMKQVKASRERTDDEPLDLFGSFTENGFKVSAYMPKNSDQTLEWTVRIYKDGEDEVFREETIDMVHPPIFGVDVEDKATLELRVNEIMQELAR